MNERLQSLKPADMRPLVGVRVLDCLNPAARPLATLMLAETKAELLKIERLAVATSCGAHRQIGLPINYAQSQRSPG